MVVMNMNDKDIVYESKYFIVTKQVIEKRKTPIYHIISLDGIEIGKIKWYQSWRKYCLFPDGDTIWDNKCLKDVITIMDELNLKHK
jgi:hypothetical protein